MSNKPLSYNDPIGEVFKFSPDDDFAYVAFSILYTDGSIYEVKENLLHNWDEALSKGVQLVVVYISDIDADGNYLRQFIQGYDYYSFDGKYFYGGNDSRGLLGTIIYGEWTTDEEFESIRQNALNRHVTSIEREGL